MLPFEHIVAQRDAEASPTHSAQFRPHSRHALASKRDGPMKAVPLGRMAAPRLPTAPAPATPRSPNAQTSGASRVGHVARRDVAPAQQPAHSYTGSTGTSETTATAVGWDLLPEVEYLPNLKRIDAAPPLTHPVPPQLRVSSSTIRVPYGVATELPGFCSIYVAPEHTYRDAAITFIVESLHPTAFIAPPRVGMDGTLHMLPVAAGSEQARDATTLRVIAFDAAAAELVEGELPQVMSAPIDVTVQFGAEDKRGRSPDASPARHDQAASAAEGASTADEDAFSYPPLNPQWLCDPFVMLRPHLSRVPLAAPAPIDDVCLALLDFDLLPGADPGEVERLQTALQDADRSGGDPKRILLQLGAALGNSIATAASAMEVYERAVRVHSALVAPDELPNLVAAHEGCVAAAISLMRLPDAIQQLRALVALLDPRRADNEWVGVTLARSRARLAYCLALHGAAPEDVAAVLRDPDVAEADALFPDNAEIRLRAHAARLHIAPDEDCGEIGTWLLAAATTTPLSALRSGFATLGALASLRAGATDAAAAALGTSDAAPVRVVVGMALAGRDEPAAARAQWESLRATMDGSSVARAVILSACAATAARVPALQDLAVTLVAEARRCGSEAGLAPTDVRIARLALLDSALQLAQSPMSLTGDVGSIRRVVSQATGALTHVLAATHPDHGAAVETQAYVELCAGDVDAAVAFARHCLTLRLQSAAAEAAMVRAAQLVVLCCGMQSQPAPAEAGAILMRHLNATSEAHGVTSAMTLRPLIDVAAFRALGGDYEGAAADLARALKVADTANTIFLLGPLFRPAAQLTEDEVAERQRLVATRLHRDSGLDFAAVLFGAASVMERQGRLFDAEFTLLQVLASLEIAERGTSPATVAVFLSMSRLLYRDGHFGDALAYAERAEAMLHDFFPEARPLYDVTHAQLRVLEARLATRAGYRLRKDVDTRFPFTTFL